MPAHGTVRPFSAIRQARGTAKSFIAGWVFTIPAGLVADGMECVTRLPGDDAGRVPSLAVSNRVAGRPADLGAAAAPRQAGRSFTARRVTSSVTLAASLHPATPDDDRDSLLEALLTEAVRLAVSDSACSG